MYGLVVIRQQRFMKTLKVIFFSLLIFSTVAWNSNKKKKFIGTEFDTTIVQNKKSLESDTFVKESIDTSNYLGLKYYDTTMDHAGSQGYVDTFTIHNYKFRIVHQDTLFDGVVEVNKNGKWYRTMQFVNLGNHNDYNISFDLDGDGYNDLIFYWKWFGEIHFFDPTKNEFCDRISSNIGIDWTLLDTSNHIFYENEFGKEMNSPVYSNLFTFKNAKRIDIAALNIYFDPNDENGTFIKGLLYKNGSKVQIEKVKPKEKVNIDDFDYLKFWKKRYKGLIGNH